MCESRETNKTIIGRSSNKPLHEAVWNNDLDRIEYHLKENEGVNEKDENELRPLDIAIMTNNLRVVKLLVSTKKSDITIDFTSFHYLACTQNDDMIAYLLAEDCVPRIRNPVGENLLHLAVIHGYEKFVEKICRYHPGYRVDVNEPTRNGFTPLHLAIKYNQSNIFCHLIHEREADITKKSSDGRSSIHLAVEQGNDLILLMLLEKGANVNDVVTSTGACALHVAVKRNNLDMVKVLLANKANLLCRDNKGWNSLHLAAQCGHTNLAKFFLDEGLDINSLTDDNSCPLLLAIKNKRDETVQMFLNNGADVNIMNKSGLNPMCASIISKNHSLTMQLLSLGGKIKDLVELNQSLLHISLKHGDLEFAKVLLKKKIRLNVRDHLGQNELHLAAQFGNADIVRTLLKRKMDVNELTLNRCTALHYALKSKEIVELLINHGIKIDAENEDGDTALCVGAKTNCCIDAFEFLLISGANTNHVPKNKVMPLLTSIATSTDPLSLPKARLLAKHGAHLQGLNPKGDSCLHAIMKYGRACGYSILEMVEAFLNFGANINCVNQDHETPLITCLENFGNFVEHVIQSFVDKGAKMTKNKAGESPLHIAIRNKLSGPVLYFVEKGFDLKSTTPNGSTPLHYAAQHGDEEIIKSLLNAGLRVDDTNDDWKTPLHLAASQGSVEAIKVLLEHDADIHVKDRNRDTALHLAVSRGNLEIVKFLIHKKAFTCDKNLKGFTVYDIADQIENKHIYQCLIHS